jgi:hypothetical protein
MRNRRRANCDSTMAEAIVSAAGTRKHLKTLDFTGTLRLSLTPYDAVVARHNGREAASLTVIYSLPVRRLVPTRTRDIRRARATRLVAPRSRASGV